MNDGRPALTQSEEASLVVGYEEGGKKLLLRRYATQDPGYVPMKQWPWGFSIIGSRKDAVPDRRGQVVESLRLAVKMPAMEECEGYWCGHKAYDAWIAWLRGEAEQDRGSMLGNGHCYYCLLDARGSAAIYLRSVADEFCEAAAERLRKAAGIYDQIASALTVRCPTEIAPMPWMLKEGQTWTQQMRDEEAGILEQVHALDRQAVAEIGRALAALDGA